MTQTLTRAAIVAEARRWIGTTGQSSPNEFRCDAGEVTTPWGFIEGLYRNLTGGHVHIFDMEKRFAPAAEKMAFTIALMRCNPVFDEIMEPRGIGEGDVALYMVDATRVPDIHWGIVAKMPTSGAAGHIGAFAGAVQHYYSGVGIWKAPGAAFRFAGVK